LLWDVTRGRNAPAYPGEDDLGHLVNISRMAC
jgi:hypothetical protein